MQSKIRTDERRRCIIPVYVRNERTNNYTDMDDTNAFTQLSFKKLKKKKSKIRTDERRRCIIPVHVRNERTNNYTDMDDTNALTQLSFKKYI